MNMHMCLATGETDPVKGVATATKADVCGWVTKRCDVMVTINEVDTLMFLGQDLQLVSGDPFSLHHKVVLVYYMYMYMYLAFRDLMYIKACRRCMEVLI